MEKDYYHILNLTPPVNEEDVKQAYRTLAKQYHPDVNPSPGAHEKFIEISEAYEVLLEKLSHHTGNIIDYSDDNVITSEYINELKRKARERTQENARKKYEKLKKEHEAFQESGLYDFVLLISYLARGSLFLLCVGLVIFSILLSFGFTETPVMVRILMIVSGGTGVFLILSNFRHYFKAGQFFYNYKQLKKFFSYVNSETEENCFYSPGHKANSRPYKVDMMMIKGVKLRNYGWAQHSVSFDQKSVTVDIPRSHHALVVHSLLIVLKFFILLSSMVFLPIDSFLWRILLGIISGILLSRLVLLISNTRSTSSYLITPGLIIRTLVWMNLIVVLSHLQFNPFNIYTSELVYGLVVFIFIFDTFLDQFLNFVSNQRFTKPIFRQPPQIESLLAKKYQFGYDMPILSVIYPLYKWFLG
jgi:hypothetical protein